MKYKKRVSQMRNPFLVVRHPPTSWVPPYKSISSLTSSSHKASTMLRMVPLTTYDAPSCARNAVIRHPPTSWVPPYKSISSLTSSSRKASTMLRMVPLTTLHTSISTINWKHYACYICRSRRC